MARRRNITPCCGPFAQKQRKIEELDIKIKRLVKATGENAKQQASLQTALAQKRAILGWMAAHNCVPPELPAGRPTRLA
jgi:hypothetical protein